MLALTDTAAQAINSVVAANALPEGSGVRITASDHGALELSVASQPAADDTVIEDSGATVFLEPTAAEVLEDKVLDAHQVIEDGAEQVRFAIAPQDAEPTA